MGRRYTSVTSDWGRLNSTSGDQVWHGEVMAAKTSLKVIVPSLLALLAVGVANPSAALTGASGPRDLWLDLNQPIAEISPVGSMPLHATVVSEYSSGLVSAPGRIGQGQAVRTPAEGAPGGKAVLAIAADEADPLSPGWRAFVFGADVLLDDASGSAMDPTDNGDNIVQRGLYNQPGQYKIQVDNRRPSCRIQGSSGAVMVAPERDLAAGVWYRITCARNLAAVTLTVTEYAATGQVASSQNWVEHGAIGSVTARNGRVPLAVGGKLTEDGRLAQQTDQFNGVIDNIGMRVS